VSISAPYTLHLTRKNWYTSQQTSVPLTLILRCIFQAVFRDRQNNGDGNDKNNNNDDDDGVERTEDEDDQVEEDETDIDLGVDVTEDTDDAKLQRLSTAEKEEAAQVHC
jgi:hypothetical protein